MKKEQTIGDMSAVLTGILLALNLPVTLPFWQATIGCFVAIVIVKQLFGGLGQNFANPAIVGRIVLMLSFTSNMTTWALPKYYNSDGTLSVSADYVKIGSSKIVTGATPLVTGDASYKDLFLGNVGGCIGETCALALIIGGVYLIIRGIISPVTPVAFIGTVALLDLGCRKRRNLQYACRRTSPRSVFHGYRLCNHPDYRQGKAYFWNRLRSYNVSYKTIRQLPGGSVILNTSHEYSYALY